MIFQIAGQAPKVNWKRNVGRKKRTIAEAIAVAEANGLIIPGDVVFVEAESGDLPGGFKNFNGMETARGPDVTEHPDGCTYWHDHYNRFGKIVIRVHPEVLTGDECIVGVFQHELFELAALREVFMLDKRKRMNATDYGTQVLPGYKGNFHDQAWDASDEAVHRMRTAKR